MHFFVSRIQCFGKRYESNLKRSFLISGQSCMHLGFGAKPAIRILKVIYYLG
jgi:hypothetical protein